MIKKLNSRGLSEYMKIKSRKINKFLKLKISVFAAALLILMVLTAIFGPELCKYSPYAQNQDNRFAPVSKEHWLGTDYAGRDTFTRVVYGAKISLGLALTGVGIGLITGVSLGLISGYYGGAIDSLISRAIELLMAFPGLFIALITIALLGRSNINTAFAVAMSTVPSFMRITRSNVIAIKETDYVKSCVIIGESDLRIILTHVLPNAISLIIVTFTLNLGTALLTVSSLSYLGIGVNPPEPEWGAMISASKDAVISYPIGIIAPGLAITAFVMCANLVGDGLRDVLDPKNSL